MIKLRVEGLPEEVDAFTEGLEPYCDVFSKSEPYANRGKSKYVRVYMEIHPVTKQEFLKKAKNPTSDL